MPYSWKFSFRRKPPPASVVSLSLSGRRNPLQRNPSQLSEATPAGPPRSYHGVATDVP